ncbi:MAG: acetate/propionate family kinase [Nitrospirae bacterium]|nr:acetate/propionate family kinase [Nitrospirota bacterium]
MIVLTVNTGSSSVRLSLKQWSSQESFKSIGSVRYDHGDGERDDLLHSFLNSHGINEVDIVSHRVVHGGSTLVSSRILDDGSVAEIKRLELLAPLHNRHAVEWIQTSIKIVGKSVPQVGVFDTAFYSSLPAAASSYAIPDELSKRYFIRRYGFHGLAHQAMWQRWCELRPDLLYGGRVISLQLGAGCSVTATDRGVAMDTSMGFTPSEGLMMATRCGDIDSGLVTFLQRMEGLTPEAADHLLEKESGLLGVSGISSDMRKLINSDSPDALHAVNLFCYRARKYIGAYMAVLGGVDGILFGGGVGENVAQVRKGILDGMEWCGIVLNDSANMNTIGSEGRISDAQGQAEVWVIPVDEAGVLAREAVRIINRQ